MFPLHTLLLVLLVHCDYRSIQYLLATGAQGLLTHSVYSHNMLLGINFREKINIKQE